MDDKDILRHYGEAYDEIAEKQRSNNRLVKTVVALDVATSTGNYFLMPNERFAFTVVPLIGGLVIWSVNRYAQTYADKIQDGYIPSERLDTDEGLPEESD